MALLDTKYPNSARRPELHARLLEFYAGSGESEAVIRAGREFLANFPNAPQRTPVALLMADAYARTGNTQEEFAIYDSVLQELALKAQKIPLGRVRRAAAGLWSEATQENPDGETVSEFSERPAKVRRSAMETRHSRSAPRHLPI